MTSCLKTTEQPFVPQRQGYRLAPSARSESLLFAMRTGPCRKLDPIYIVAVFMGRFPGPAGVIGKIPDREHLERLRQFSEDHYRPPHPAITSRWGQMGTKVSEPARNPAGPAESGHICPLMASSEGHVVQPGPCKASHTTAAMASMNSGRALKEAVRRIVIPLDRANACASTSRS
jgi:hypothetical protein